MNIKSAKRIDLVTYLQSLNHTPIKISGNDYWYQSPLRDEKTPSFKVNKKFGIWRDYGTGEGGTIIDFGIKYFNCTISEFLQILDNKQSNFSLQQQKTSSDINHVKPTLVVSQITEIQSLGLINYLKSRKINISVARKFCKEIFYKNVQKQINFSAIGFENISGGYELRKQNLKLSISPKDISFIDNQLDSVAVFEGFFDFLSSFTVKNLVPEPTNWLVLNSLALLEKSIPLLKQHKKVYLLLDNDTAGSSAVSKLLGMGLGLNISDLSDKYKPHKDINEWLVKEKNLDINPNIEIGSVIRKDRGMSL